MSIRKKLSVLLAAATLCLAIDQPHQQVLSPDPGRYAVQTPPLDTDWTYTVGTNPWPQNPRPKLARSPWQSLNGIWTYANAESHRAILDPPFNRSLPQEVLVPFCLESGLSGIQGRNTIYSWYRTTFDVPSSWTNERVLLNSGAVDYEATVFLNGQDVSFHRGGYTAFSIDITDHVHDRQNELILFVYDPTDSEVIPTGKQTLNPSHIWYTPCSGIWQSVWLESAPWNYVADLAINGDQSGQVNLTVASSQHRTSRVEITLYERESGNVVASHIGMTDSPIISNVQSAKLWSPARPNLYDVTIRMANDMIDPYVGFRSVHRQDIHGVQRVLINGEVIFPFGTLDQGYWPDGLYTAPTYDAMVYDMKVLKHLGYNMLRKHIKVEPALYYAAADELGILVMQDMPSLANKHLPTKSQHEEFVRQIEVIVKQFQSYSSIFSWVIYNEGCGQVAIDRPEYAIVERVREIDPTRLVNAVSGWYDHGAGDFSDNHHYVSPQCGTPWHADNVAPFDRLRIGFQGEFGGSGHNVSARHLWKVQQAIDGINQTYELFKTIDEWNFRGHLLLTELLYQIQVYSCAGGVWTETTDVEGEVNGMMTYDRRILRPHVEQWQSDIQALYDASALRSNETIPKFAK